MIAKPTVITAIFLAASCFALPLKADDTCPVGFRLDAASKLCMHTSPYVTPSPGYYGPKLTPDKMALNPKAIALGRLLFFDPILSKSSDLSCAHCHAPAHGLGDGQPVSRGHGGKALLRNAPALWNVTFKRHFFWDGRVATLEDQALGPLYHPDEFGNAVGEAAARVARIPAYAALFKDVYGNSAIDDLLLAAALSDFQRSLVSLSSRFDRYAMGDHAAFSTNELKGYNVFRSFVSRCPECHTPPLFANGQKAVIGAPAGHDPPLSAFLTPSLRNIAKTAPYMHAGSFATLEDVLRFYDRGGGRGSLARDAMNLHWHIRPLSLGETEKQAIVAFLQTLTDEQALPKPPSQVPSGLPVLRGE